MATFPPAIRITFFPLCMALIILFSQHQPGLADQTVGGTLSGPVSWLDNEVITVTTTVTVEGDLTIGKGVHVEMAPDSAFLIANGGSVVASGQPGHEIYFTSDSPGPSCGDWTGIVFQATAATSSTLSWCVVEYAQIGVDIDSMSPIIENCIIQKLCGGPGAVGINGSSGDFTPPSDTLGENGTAGTAGSAGEDAIGIRVTGSSEAVVSYTTITLITGGKGGGGGNGGHGGHGGSGVCHATAPTVGQLGGNGGAGGAGGAGGSAYGITVGPAAQPTITDCVMKQIAASSGGSSGTGGNGGNGGAGGCGLNNIPAVNGQPGGGGGGGGVGALGAPGGRAIAIYLESVGSGTVVARNNISNLLAGTGGTGGQGGRGGNGGTGGRGGQECSGSNPGGNGGGGRLGAAAGIGGAGGLAAGIYIASSTLSAPVHRNTISEVTGGQGGVGGRGGNGGNGGTGGNGGNATCGGSSVPGNGGNGSAGGAGAIGTTSGAAGIAHGIAATSANFTASVNLIHDIKSGNGNVGGQGGNGGNGGNGGLAGTNSSGSTVSATNGCRGAGGNAGAGGASTAGVNSFGVSASSSSAAAWIHNTIADIKAGTFGLSGGTAGTAGLAGTGTCGGFGGSGAAAGLTGNTGIPVAMRAESLSNCTATNNCLANDTTVAPTAIGMQAVSATITENYNNISSFPAPRTGVVAGANSTAKAPGFRDWTNDDFHLEKLSVLIDIGTTPTSVVDDIDGHPRDLLPDIGADEILGDLGLEKFSATDPVAAGTTQTWTLIVTNPMMTTSTDVILTDSLPPETTFLSSSPGAPTCTASSGVVTCNLGTLSGGTSTTVTINALVSSNVTSGTAIVNQASVTSAQPDNNPSDNTASNLSTSNVVSNLSIATTESADPVMEGENIVYTITVHNDGPSNEQAVVVKNTLPQGLTFVSSMPGSPTCTESGGIVTCSLGALASGASTQVEITALVNALFVSNLAEVSGAAPDSDTLNNQITVQTGIISLPTGDQTGPVASPPSDEGIFTSSTLLAFNWSAASDPSGVASYDLQIGTTPGASNVFNGNVGSVLASSTSNTTDGQQLWARLRSYDSPGNVGEWTECSDGIIVDVRKPVSHATAGAGSVETTNTVFHVLYTAQDETSGTVPSGILGVELWYRTGTSGPFELYSNILYNDGYVPFDTDGLGGNGTYQFYTMAVDRAGNREDVSANTPDLTVIFNGQVPVSISHWMLE